MTCPLLRVRAELRNEMKEIIYLARIQDAHVQSHSLFDVTYCVFCVVLLRVSKCPYYISLNI